MTRSANRLVATVVGAGYLGFGLLGFVVTTAVGFSAPAGGLLLGVQVNPLQNLAHIAIGVALLLCGRFSVQVAKTGNAVVGAVMLAFGLVGLFIIGSDGNVFALNGAGNMLHFGTSIVLLAVGLGADKGDSQQKRSQPRAGTR